MSTIDEVKARLDIVEIVSEQVQLRKSGRSYMGFCPFHSNTRTPAFTVYPDTQSFYCFGCQAAGTVFDFVMRSQGIDFSAALAQLAQRAGVELRPRTENDRQQDEQRARLLEINGLVARYFAHWLMNHERGAESKAYLERRGLTQETMERFQLGYAPDSWDLLFNWLTDKKGYSPEEIELVGLTVKRDQGGWYDRFRNRVMFPIRNARGEIIGFGGRVMGEGQPKYMNSPQTPLFDKSATLFGFDLAREAIRGANAAVLVEGYMDVIMAHQHGFSNVVAPLGTALNEQHVAHLQKLAKTLILALDADAAGLRATLRGLDVAQRGAGTDEMRPTVTASGLVRWERDLRIRVLLIPDERDPDEVIHANPDEWRTLVDDSLPVMDFLIRAYTADLDLKDAMAQRSALERLVPALAQLDAVEQRIYIAQLERMLGMRAELILDLVNAESRPPRPRKGERRQSSLLGAGPRVAASVPANARTLPEDRLLALLLRFPLMIAVVEDLLQQEVTDFPATPPLLGETIDRLIERTENRLIWEQWADYVASQSSEELSAFDENNLPGDWAESLSPDVDVQLTLLARLSSPQQQFLRRDAEQHLRTVRMEQARRLYQRLIQRADELEVEDESERASLFTDMTALTAYIAAGKTPRRTGIFTDLRDFTGSE